MPIDPATAAIIARVVPLAVEAALNALAERGQTRAFMERAQRIIIENETAEAVRKELESESESSDR